MTTYKLFMTACAAVGVAVLLGTVSGCEDSKQPSSLLVNPDAARLTEKMPTITYDTEPAPGDTAVGDTVVITDSTEVFEGICIDEAEPVDPQPGAEPAAVCAQKKFHMKFPNPSKDEKGTHITTKANYSNYDIGGGRIMRHVKTWPFESTWTYW